MFKKKSKIAILFLISCFILSKSLLLLHGFSHQNFTNIAAIEDQNFLTKFFGEHKKSGKSSDDCLLCSVLNLQNQISVIDSLSFAASCFLLIFAFRFFDSVKLSFLLASHHSRAPPTFS